MEGGTISLLQLCCRSHGELSLNIYPFSRYDVWARSTDLVFSVAPNRLAFLALCWAALLLRSSSLGPLRCRRSGVNSFPTLAPLPLPGFGHRAVTGTRAPTAEPGTRGAERTARGWGSDPARSPRVGFAGAAGAVRGAAGRCAGRGGGSGGARPLGSSRSRPAAAAVPLPGPGQAERGGGGGPEQARRDRPRPLLPAGEALKHPGEARSPALGSPDPRVEASGWAENRSAAAAAVSAATGRAWAWGQGRGRDGDGDRHGKGHRDGGRGASRAGARWGGGAGPAVGASADGGFLPHPIPPSRCRAPWGCGCRCWLSPCRCWSAWGRWQRRTPPNRTAPARTPPQRTWPDTTRRWGTTSTSSPGRGRQSGPASIPLSRSPGCLFPWRGGGEESRVPPHTRVSPPPTRRKMWCTDSL